MKQQLNIVVPVISNDFKAFLDELCQLAPFNTPKIHVVALLGRNQPKLQFVMYKNVYMRGPAEFGYAIESNLVH